MAMDKICLHVMEGYNGRFGQARLVKLVNVSVPYVREVRNELGYEVPIIVRFEQAHQPLEDPEQNAEEWFHRYAARMWDMQAVAGPRIYFEGLNEIADGEAPEYDTAQRYALFELRRIELMHGSRYRAVVGNWSVGTPDLPVWAIYAPVLDAMNPETDLVGLHEYWIDEDDIDNRWHCGRWTLVPELQARPGHRIVVTECGRDRVEGQGAAGWQKTCGPDQFLRDLRKYNELLMEHPRVLGATVFTGGRIYEDWRDFDVNGIWPRVVAQYDWHDVSAPPPADEPAEATRIPTRRIKLQSGEIVELDVERIVKGVVPVEVWPDAEDELLKAQAIAARSYAIANEGRHADEGYDLCSAQHCQAFRADAGTPKTDAAVDATRGVVGTYEGRVVPMFYSASCGGQTLDVDFNGNPLPWLRAWDGCPCADHGHEVRGHQRGLCQWGARYLADPTLRTFEAAEILDCYYDLAYVSDWGQGEVVWPKAKEPEPDPRPEDDEILDGVYRFLWERTEMVPIEQAIAEGRTVLVLKREGDE